MTRLETRAEWPSIAAAIRDGWSLREAAEVFGCAPGSIRGALKRTGEPPAHGRSGPRKGRPVDLPAALGWEPRSQWGMLTPDVDAEARRLLPVDGDTEGST